MTSADSRELRVLLLSDGRPGHYHLAEGIVAALSRKRAMRIERLDARRNGWPGRPLAWMLRAGVPPDLLLRHVYKLRRPLPPADIIVSAGAETLAANIAAARLLGAPNIFYGSLRQFRPDMFALSLTSYAEQATRDNRVMFLKPSAIDPDAIGRPPPDTGAGAATVPNIAALVIGGDAPGFHYGDEDWGRLFQFLETAHAQLGTRWIITNSPRTGSALGDRVRELESTRPGVVARFIDVRQAGAGTLVDVLATAVVAVCTADSSTMVSEAVWSRRPVLAVTPAGHRFTPAEQGYREYLARNGWYRSLAIADLSPGSFSREVSGITPLRDNPLDRLADLIEARIPHLFNAPPVMRPHG